MSVQVPSTLRVACYIEREYVGGRLAGDFYGHALDISIPPQRAKTRREAHSLLIGAVGQEVRRLLKNGEAIEVREALPEQNSPAVEYLWITVDAPTPDQLQRLAALEVEELKREWSLFAEELREEAARVQEQGRAQFGAATNRVTLPEPYRTRWVLLSEMAERAEAATEHALMAAWRRAAKS